MLTLMTAATNDLVVEASSLPPSSTFANTFLVIGCSMLVIGVIMGMMGSNRALAVCLLAAVSNFGVIATHVFEKIEINDKNVAAIEKQYDISVIEAFAPNYSDDERTIEIYMDVDLDNDNGTTSCLQTINVAQETYQILCGKPAFKTPLESLA